MATDAALEHARGSHTNLQEMVKLADQKAATLMGAAGVIVALLGSNLIDKFVEKGVPRTALWCGATTLLLLLGAALCSILVLVPRSPGEKQVAPVAEAPRLMWGLSRFSEDAEGYLRALRSTTRKEAVADLAHENLKITWILERKWMWLGRAARVLVLGFVAWAASVVAIVVGG